MLFNMLFNKNSTGYENATLKEKYKKTQETFIKLRKAQQPNIAKATKTNLKQPKIEFEEDPNLTHDKYVLCNTEENLKRRTFKHYVEEYFRKNNSVEYFHTMFLFILLCVNIVGLIPICYVPINIVGLIPIFYVPTEIVNFTNLLYLFALGVLGAELNHVTKNVCSTTTDTTNQHDEHDEQTLAGTVITLAFDFVGSNNCPCVPYVHFGILCMNMLFALIMWIPVIGAKFLKLFMRILVIGAKFLKPVVANPVILILVTMHFNSICVEAAPHSAALSEMIKVWGSNAKFDGLSQNKWDTWKSFFITVCSAFGHLEVLEWETTADQTVVPAPTGLKDQAVFYFLSMTCTGVALNIIRPISNGAKAWKALLSKYDGLSTSGKHNLNTQITTLKVSENEDPDVVLTQIREYFDRLNTSQGANEKYPESFLFTNLIRALNNVSIYSTIVNECELGKITTIQEIIDLARAAYEQHKLKKREGSITMTLDASRKCHKCGNAGHFARDCAMKNPGKGKGGRGGKGNHKGGRGNKRPAGEAHLAHGQFKKGGKGGLKIKDGDEDKNCKFADCVTRGRHTKHTANQCFYNPESPAFKECTKCGKPGHDADRCRSKSSANFVNGAPENDGDADIQI